MARPPSVDSVVLEGLHDVPLPEPVSLWPQAPGWYGLGSILLIVLGFWAWRRACQFRRQRYRREARAALARLERQPLAGQVLGLQHILKRAALYAYPCHGLAPLAGKAWLAFLDESAPCRFAELGEPWQAALLLPPADWTLSEAEMAGLIGQARLWVVAHAGGRHA